MNALLGKIIKIKSRRPSARRPATRRFEVTLKPVCVMPRHTRLPEWLKDRDLTVVRTVPDARELGDVGDSIVLTPAESARWLFPMTVHPATSHGAVPARLRLELAWWKDKKPGPVTVTAAGRRRTVKWQKAGSAFQASVATDGMFAAKPVLPVVLKAEFDKLTAECAVLPTDRPCHARTLRAADTVHHLRNAWYAVDVTPAQGAGIAALVEQCRGVDHFARDPDRIQDALGLTGHRDKVEIGWSDKLGGVRMSGAGSRTEGDTLRLLLEGIVDKERNIRTTVCYALPEALPCVLVHREAMLLEPGKPDKKDEPEKPREPCDKLVRVALGFRTAFGGENAANADPTRIVSVDGARLSVIRHSVVLDRLWDGWALRDGWIVAERPKQRCAMLFLFDSSCPPRLGTHLTDRSVTVEGQWPPFPGLPERGGGFALALSAGECWGASTAGAWVACRRQSKDGGIDVGVIARTRNGSDAVEARIKLGAQSATVQLSPVRLQGIDQVLSVTHRFAKGTTRQQLKVALPALDRTDV